MNDPGKQSGHLHHRRSIHAAECVDPLERHDKIQALIEQFWKGVSRIQALRAQEGQQFTGEIAANPSELSRAPIRAFEKADLVLLKLRNQVVIQNDVLLTDQLVRHVRNSLELLSWSQPIGSGLTRAVSNLLLQACDTDFEKFVEIRTDDAQEI